MRADRLLSIMMLLQARERMTAQDLAEELEVSVRTIYRDLDALSVAGVPVYAERGPGGGCALLDSYRTTLTGLTPDEVRALFMLSIPAPLAELGVASELKAALRKLAAALPEARRGDEVRARQRIHLDPADWSQQAEPAPYLQTIRQAVWESRKLHLTRHLHFGTELERLVAPYGLVAKATIWYLVCGREEHIHVYRVSQVVGARLTDETFVRPADFDLAAFWRAWCADVEQKRSHYPVTARIAPDLIPHLVYLFGDDIHKKVAGVGPPDAEGWFTLTLPFESLEAARRLFLGLGGAVEILAPQALRDTVADFAAQIVARYRRQEFRR